MPLHICCNNVGHLITWQPTTSLKPTISPLLSTHTRTARQPQPVQNNMRCNWRCTSSYRLCYLVEKKYLAVNSIKIYIKIYIKVFVLHANILQAFQLINKVQFVIVKDLQVWAELRLIHCLISSSIQCEKFGTYIWWQLTDLVLNWRSSENLFSIYIEIWGLCVEMHM